MSTIEEVQSVKDIFFAEFGDLPYVVGVGIGFTEETDPDAEIPGGYLVDREARSYALYVMLEQEPPEDNPLPDFVDDVPVTYTITGAFYPQVLEEKQAEVADV